MCSQPGDFTYVIYLDTQRSYYMQTFTITRAAANGSSLHFIRLMRKKSCLSCQLTRIVRTEAEDDVTIVGNGDGVLGGWQVELSMQETSLIEIESVLQIDLFHVPIGRTADTDHVERISVQMERMRQIGLLYCNQSYILKNQNILLLSTMRYKNKINYIVIKKISLQRS